MSSNFCPSVGGRRGGAHPGLRRHWTDGQMDRLSDNNWPRFTASRGKNPSQAARLQLATFIIRMKVQRERHIN